MEFSHRILLPNKSIQLALNFLRARITVEPCTSSTSITYFSELYLHKKHLKYICCSCLSSVRQRFRMYYTIPMPRLYPIRKYQSAESESQKARWKRAIRATTLYGSFFMGKRCLKIKETIPSGIDAHRSNTNNEWISNDVLRFI